MARKSRRSDIAAKIGKKENSGIAAPSKKQKLQTGIYGRLSIKDLGQEDGDTMETQIALLRDYVLQHPDLELREVYIDNGWTGTNFQRPEFSHMLEDIQAGKINCIVVKDLSRLGRNYLEAGYYLQHVFPSLQVRFIAIYDGYDSATGDPESMVIAMKNIVNDYYSKDISRKISAVIDMKRSQGPHYMGAPPYGYQMSTRGKKRYVIDKQAAPYLHLMFKWALEGVPPHEIASYLNEMNAPTPSQHYYQLHPDQKKAARYRDCTWKGYSVRSILLNQTYAGDFVCRKSYFRKYDPGNSGFIPEEDWMIYPDTHEAYISHEDYARLKKRLLSDMKRRKDRRKRRQRQIRNQDNPLQGIVYCGECGRRMRLVKKGESRCDWYFSCSGKEDYAHIGHQPYSAEYGELETQVLYNLQMQLKTAIDADNFLRSRSLEDAQTRLKASRNASLQMLYSRQAALTSQRKQAFEDLASGILDKETYQLRTAKLEQEAKWLSGDIERAKKRVAEIDTYLTPDNEWLKSFLSANISPDLDSRAVHQLVNHIEVWHNSQILIVFNYADCMEKFLRCLKELNEIGGKGSPENCHPDSTE